jgi:uncharacterized Zn finger protein
MMNEIETAFCPMCNNESQNVLGVLGRKLYYRCECCGMDFYINIKQGEK